MSENYNVNEMDLDNEKFEEKKLIPTLRKKLKYRVFFFLTIFIFLLIGFLIYPLALSSSPTYSLQSTNFKIIDMFKKSSFYWIVGSLLGLFFIRIIKIIKFRKVPFLSNYIQQELQSLNFNIHKNYTLEILSLLDVFIIGITLVLFDFKILQLTTFIVIFITTSGILLLIVFALFQLIKSNIYVKLTNRYSITIKIQFSLFNQGKLNILNIHLKSNILEIWAFRKNKSIIKKIKEKRWLPIREDTFLQRIKSSLFPVFTEYSTFSNFCNKFLNLAIALRDWDNFRKSKP